MKTSKLYLFDVDGTLCHRHENNLTAATCQVIRERFADLTAFALVSNQGGVGWRYAMESQKRGDPDKKGLPTADSVAERLKGIEAQIHNALGRVERVPSLPLAAFTYQYKSSGHWTPDPPEQDRGPFGLWGAKYRKPSPHMLTYAANFLGYSPINCTVIGDDLVDEQAAHKAGMIFYYAQTIFKLKG